VSAERVVVRAPGRVNLIGEHTDYAGGFVLPIAIDMVTTIAGQRGHDRIVLMSTDDATPAEVPLVGADPSKVTGWARYVAAVVAELSPETGFIGEVGTSIPIGAGLSSSAALEVALALALLGPEAAAATDRGALAEACQRAELAASGVPCGVMDQLASLCGVAHHALLIDCTTLSVQPVALPDDVAIVVIDSGERRALAHTGYADRRSEVARAIDLVGSLRDATLDAVASIEDPVVRKRARHVVTENARVQAFVHALAADDLEAAGDLLMESHRSLRDDHDVSTPFVDQLVERLAVTDGVFGARLTGGGFGGCVVALTEPGALDVGWHVTPSPGATIERL
jgi:galactokinase